MRVESTNDYGVNATEGESGERNLSLFRGEERTVARVEKLRAIARDLGWDGSLCATGPESAEIAIVGQAYGSHDEAEDQPLSGPSGKLIKDIMHRAGVDWTQLYITNISKIRPPGDHWEQLPRPVSDFIPILIHELSSLPNLKLIIPCGKIPTEILCGKSGIDKYRGSILECTLPMLNHVKCIPTYNPAEIFHKYWKSWVQVFDFKRIKEESTYADLRLPEYEFHYAESVDEISEWLRRNEGKTSSVDTETYQPLQISCMSISQSPYSAFSIPFFEGGRPKWTQVEEIQLYREIDRFFSSTPTIMQNAMYDLFVFRWLGYSVPPELCVMDTMLAHCCIYPELPHGLDFLCSIYTRQPYYKDEGKVWHPSFSYQQLRRYNCIDAATTFDCALQLREELKEFGLEEFFREQYMEMIPPLLASSIDGIKFSTRKQLYIREIYTAARNALQEEVNDLVGHEINVGSSPQMCKYLYEELNLPPKYKKDKEGNQRITADETALQKLAREHDHPGLRKIVSLRHVRKVISTYIDIPYDSDYRIRCSFNLMGTNTGRISEGPCPTGSGMTLHNLPRKGAKVKISGVEYNLPDVKEMLIADEGCTIFRPDYKQAEIYIVATLAEEPMLMEYVFKGKDIHRFVASEFIYHKPMDKITELERYLAKRTVHACLPTGHEVLTFSGWQDISKITEEDEIAQWNYNETTKKGEVEFVHPTKTFEYYSKENLIAFNGTAFQQVTTPNHKLPVTSTAGINPYKLISADSLPMHGSLPINGEYLGESEINNLPQEEQNSLFRSALFAIALAADGGLEGTGKYYGNLALFHMSKQRKIDRLYEITPKSEIVSNNLDEKNNNSNTRRIRVRLTNIPYLSNFIELKQKTKNLSWIMIHLPLEMRKQLISEFLEWDGTTTYTTKEGIKKQQIYSTTNLQNARLFQTLAHISGLEVLIREYEDPRGNRKKLYTCSLNQRTHANLLMIEQKAERFNGNVYCVEVPSHMFLIRYKNTISITGNSNYGMSWVRFSDLLAKEEIYLPAKEVKRMLESYHRGFPMIRKKFQKSAERQLQMNRTLRNCFGRQRLFLGRLDDETFRKAYAFIPQGTVADLLNRALKKVALRYPIKGQQHDSMWVQLKDEEIEEGVKYIVECMNIPMEVNGIRFTIPVEMKYGKTLADNTEYDLSKLAA